MARFVYQTSRWQLLTYLKNTIQELYQKEHQQAESDKKEIEDLKRKQEYLSKAAGTARHHLVGPEVLQETPKSRERISVSDTVDFTPGNRRDSLLSRVSGRYSFEPMDNGGEIKGIPRKAEIGHDVHIY
jgi:hypothetical protein